MLYEPAHATSPPSGDDTFCLVSHSTETDEDFVAIAKANQARYAQAHGYAYTQHTGRISGEQFQDPSKGPLSDIVGGGLYWQKLTAVRQALEACNEGSSTRRYSWVMWLDADVLITDRSQSLHAVLTTALQSAAPKDLSTIHVVLSEELNLPINAGVFFIRNTPEGRAFVEAQSALYPLFKDTPLADQTAMTALAFINDTKPGGPARIKVHPIVCICPQRTFNSFASQGPRHKPLPPDAAWQPGDFIAHFSGTNSFRRGLLMQQMLDKISHDK